MKPRVLAKILSRMCMFMAAALCLPAFVDLLYGEDVWGYYLGTAAAALVIGLAAYYLPGGGREARLDQITRREGFFGVVASWVTMIVLGAVPFWISGAMPTLADAVFESASGYSTTGATILTDIESLARAHLFQRSLAHWVGGMGIIVLSVAILPDLAVGGMQLFSAEASGIATDKLSPRIVSTAIRPTN